MNPLGVQEVNVMVVVAVYEVVVDVDVEVVVIQYTKNLPSLLLSSSTSFLLDSRDISSSWEMDLQDNK